MKNLSDYALEVETYLRIGTNDFEVISARKAGVIAKEFESKERKHENAVYEFTIRILELPPSATLMPGECSLTAWESGLITGEEDNILNFYHEELFEKVEAPLVEQFAFRYIAKHYPSSWANEWTFAKEGEDTFFEKAIRQTVNRMFATMKREQTSYVHPSDIIDCIKNIVGEPEE